MLVLETPRLALRRLSADDAEFMLRLLNEPSFLRYIGDRNVRSVADACRYIESGPMAMYARIGFGLFLVELKEGRVPIGICGLLKRDTLDDVDVGFAFLPEHWRQGYAFESAAAVLEYGRHTHHLMRIVAITSLENEASISLLAKLGFRFERTIRMSDHEEDVRLFAVDMATWPGRTFADRMAGDSPQTIVRVARHFAAAPDRVFDAWLDAPGAGRWLFATSTGQIVRVEMDARVGGAFVIVDRRDGEDVAHEGEYLEIDRPRRLVFTFRVPRYSPEAARVTIDIVLSEPGCTLALTQELPPAVAGFASSVEAGWRGILEGLARALEDHAAHTAPPRSES